MSVEKMPLKESGLVGVSVTPDPRSKTVAGEATAWSSKSITWKDPRPPASARKAFNAAEEDGLATPDRRHLRRYTNDRGPGREG